MLVLVQITARKPNSISIIASRCVKLMTLPPSNSYQTKACSKCVINLIHPSVKTERFTREIPNFGTFEVLNLIKFLSIKFGRVNKQVGPDLGPFVIKLMTLAGPMRT